MLSFTGNNAMPAIVIMEESVAGLNAKMSFEHQAAQQRAWTIFQIANIMKKFLHPQQHFIQSHLVGHRQWTNGKIIRQAHGRIDVFGAGDAFHNDVHGLIEIRRDHARRNEAGRFKDFDGGLTHAFGQAAGFAYGLGGGQATAHEFHKRPLGHGQ